MNLIEKVVIKDGVNADTEVTINLYSGQVAEINAILATISNTRGVAAYSVNGNMARFTFAGVGDNEMYIQMDGVVFKAGGLTSIQVDISIWVLPYSVSSTYTALSDDKNRLMIVNDASNKTTINLNNIANGEYIFIQNQKTDVLTLRKTIGGTLKTYQIQPGDTVQVLSKGDSTNFVVEFWNHKSNRATIVSTTSTTNIDIYESTYFHKENIAIALNHLDNPCTISIEEWSILGREIKIINLGEESASVTLPSGHTAWSMSLPSSIPPGSFITLFLIEPTKWAFYKS